MKKEIRTNNKGFSLVELIVVVAIMAVLMVVLAPAMLRYVEKTRTQKDDSAAGEAAHAFENALAQETIYEALKTNDTITMTITADGSGKGSISFSVDTGDKDLMQEVGATVGGDEDSATNKMTSAYIKLSSKARGKKDLKCVYEAKYSDARQAFIVSCKGITGTELIHWE